MVSASATPLSSPNGGQIQGASSGLSGSPGTKGVAGPAVTSSPPIKGHNGRFLKILNPPLVHVDVADAAAKVIYSDGKVQEILVTADDATKITVEQVFIGNGADPVLYDSISRTVKTPWTIILHENHKGHGIKIVSKSGKKSNVTISTLHSGDYFEAFPLGCEVTMYSLRDTSCNDKHCREFRGVSVTSVQGTVTYKCDTLDAVKSKCTVTIGR